MAKIYEIKFYIKRNGTEYPVMINVEAMNSKDAKETVKRRWYECYEPHMFRMESRVVKPDEIIDYKHWFMYNDGYPVNGTWHSEWKTVK